MTLSAMILAAGRGSRMRPLTDHTPKPLLKVGSKSLIEWHITRLAQAGIQQLVINHAWLGEQIENALGDGSQYGVNIQYSPETEALETAAGIKKALPLLGEHPFLVISADIWCDWNPKLAHYMAQSLVSENALAHLLLVPNPEHNRNGDFGFANHRVQTKGDTNNYTYSGMGVFSPAFFDSVSASIPTPLRDPLHQAIINQQVLGSIYQGQWADIGTPERLQQIEQCLAQKPEQAMISDSL